MKKYLFLLQPIAACCGLVIGACNESICLTIAASAIWLGSVYQAKNYD